jgi:hypothetical protein
VKPPRCGVALLASLALLTAAVSCRSKEKSQASPPPSASAQAAPASASAVARAEWYEGEWRGTYDAERQPIDMAPDAGRLRAWDQDDGSQGIGAGRITIRIDANGVVTGSAEGPLGKLVVSGAVVGDAVRLRLAPPAGSSVSAFAGVVVAVRRDGALSGLLRVSSGDSSLVRRAQVELRRQGG